MSAIIELCIKGIQRNANEATEDLKIGMIGHAMENLKKVQADAKMAIAHCRKRLRSDKASLKASRKAKNRSN